MSQNRWAYARVGIPGEGGVYTEADAKREAQGEVDGGYGMDRADMFLIDPDGNLLMPADRSHGKGPITWVPADDAFRAYLTKAGWHTFMLAWDTDEEDWLSHVR